MNQPIVQLSLLPALEAAPRPRERPVQRATAPLSVAPLSVAPLSVAPAPTAAQIAYLKKLTRIAGLTQLKRFVARRLGTDTPFTRATVAKVITLEVQERRLAA